ncbi:hypothetical protein SERLA73DRAFT_79657 [Serpula lacrymans var. lacrymans S7.3]|uniref:Uncharacterized protein n=2 Tax=Serpula lacrymans var. lacrymans TaxID=341189 RepID=F8QH49_SERL3|nr:uncharacterized protein SERLADRAFT_437849 [Serpula lacrymans var. lacrymans S7.9]EGN92377.1 hypothetical protein SERLA73DRAFT_79657 [Serpula lacrymans var. lacrymans S7.3]EGO24237.1 hypothetical protein SERLADRAFT_437849 [Serpula lacrymans var. lacrymans S7.9]
MAYPDQILGHFTILLGSCSDAAFLFSRGSFMNNITSSPQLLFLFPWPSGSQYPLELNLLLGGTVTDDGIVLGIISATEPGPAASFWFLICGLALRQITLPSIDSHVNADAIKIFDNNIEQEDSTYGNLFSAVLLEFLLLNIHRTEKFDTS